MKQNKQPQLRNSKRGGGLAIQVRGAGVLASLYDILVEAQRGHLCNHYCFLKAGPGGDLRVSRLHGNRKI